MGFKEITFNGLEAISLNQKQLNKYDEPNLTLNDITCGVP